MESGIESTSTGATTGAVWAGDAEVAALSDDELVERMTVLGRQRSRVEAMLAETAAELHRRDGAGLWRR